MMARKATAAVNHQACRKASRDELFAMPRTEHGYEHGHAEGETGLADHVDDRGAGGK